MKRGDGRQRGQQQRCQPDIAGSAQQPRAIALPQAKREQED